jgi:cysteine desulfurase
MVDAVQAFGRMELNPEESGISLMSISGHKIYGPKGVGALYIDKRIKIISLIHGGKQEQGHRAGTENVGAITAFGRTAELIHAEREKETRRLLGLREYFLKELRKLIPDAIVHGSMEHRIPHNLSIGFPYVDSGALLLSLNQIGVYVSAGSACSSGNSEPSHVLRAIGVDTEKYGTVRFSFGLRITEDDLSYLFRYLPMILHRLRVEKQEYIKTLEE